MRPSLLAAALLSACALSAQQSFPTPYEKGDQNHTPRLSETVAFCQRLAAVAPQVTLTSIGTSPQGREIPLVIVDKNGLRNAAAVRATGRAVVLIEACIHAGEPDGKDAGLMLLRDIVYNNRYPGLLDHVTILFLPIFNVDGHEDFSPYKRINQNGPEELGNRATAMRINLNRDFTKADAPEMRHWLRLYNEWMPELFIDVHVTNGADFQYVTTYAMEDCGFADRELIDWNRRVFDRQLNERMKADGYPLFPYFSFARRDQPESGIIVESFPPQYSNGYAAIQNRLGLLIENHVYKPYRQRVDATYRILLHSLELVAKHSNDLREIIAMADHRTALPEFRSHPMALMYTPTRTDSIPCDFLGWKRVTEKSDLSGAEWTRHDYNAPIAIHTHRYTSYAPLPLVMLPRAYILPPEFLEVVELLQAHAIAFERLPQEQLIEVETYRFTGAEWSKVPNEGRITASAQYTTQTEKIAFPKGSVVVPTTQSRAKLIAHLLEPDGPTSLVRWGFFNGFLRPSTEFWINLSYMEIKGREMIAKDTVLKKEFETKKAADPRFAANPQAILQFFMDKVRQHVEPNANLYPVARIL